MLSDDTSRKFRKNPPFWEKILKNFFRKISLKTFEISRIRIRELFGGGGEGTSVEILSKFWPECRNTFSLKTGFFRNFRDVSTYNTPKITFYCIFINKFPKNFEKSAQKFFAAPSAPRKTRFRRRKRVEISPFFHPWSVDGTPPPFWGDPPPPEPEFRGGEGGRPPPQSRFRGGEINFRPPQYRRKISPKTANFALKCLKNAIFPKFFLKTAPSVPFHYYTTRKHN